MLLAYLKRQYKLLLLLAGAVCIFAAVFALYDLPLEAVLYAGALCLALGLVLFAVGYSRFLRRHRELEGLLRKVHESVLPLPPPRGVLEADYQALLRAVCADRVRLAAENRDRLEDMTDYYTLWAHQIKTPIAAMDLILQTQELPESGSLKQSLFQIQQYVEMVLCYLRLDSETTDFVIRACPLDPIIRTALREFAPSFIHKGLQLHYTPVSCSVLTDEKWLLFVLEQLLSNAVKYTPHGSVTVCLREPQTLVIQDTGLGIAPEDLPRVFERGYTGKLGRVDQRSTGIGLYLCRRTLSQLGHTISIQSTPGKGTAVSIHLQRRDLPLE